MARGRVATSNITISNICKVKALNWDSEAGPLVVANDWRLTVHCTCHRLIYSHDNIFIKYIDKIPLTYLNNLTKHIQVNIITLPSLSNISWLTYNIRE